MRLSGRHTAKAQDLAMWRSALFDGSLSVALAFRFPYLHPPRSSSRLSPFCQVR